MTAPRRPTFRRSKKTGAIIAPESTITKAVGNYLALRKWDVIAWRNNTGAAKLDGKDGKKQTVRFGIPGQGDFTGAIRPWGTRLEVEVKRPELGAQSDRQRVFEKIIRDAGGVYLLVHSVEDLQQKLDAAIAELRTRFSTEPKKASGV